MTKAASHIFEVIVNFTEFVEDCLTRTYERCVFHTNNIFSSKRGVVKSRVDGATSLLDF